MILSHNANNTSQVAAGSGYQNARQMASEGIAKAQDNFRRTQAAAGSAAQDAGDAAAQTAADARDAASDHVRFKSLRCLGCVEDTKMQHSFQSPA